MTRVPAISSKAAEIPADDFSWRKYGQKLPVENALDSAVDVTRLSCGALYLADFIGKVGTYLENKMAWFILYYGLSLITLHQLKLLVVWRGIALCYKGDLL